MIFKKLGQNQKLQKRVGRLQKFQHLKDQSFDSDIKQYQDIENHKRELFEMRKNKSQAHQRQTLER